MGAPRGPLLVLESDGVTLRGTVLAAATECTPAVHAAAASAAPEPRVALAEVVERLRAATRVPRRCALLSSDVALALLPLPMATRKPRPFEQMNQLVRWELEPVFARRGAARPVGDILRAQGVLDAAAVQEVLTTQARLRSAQGAREGRTERFGEIAVRLGLATREEADRALAVQARIARVEEAEAYACGWAPTNARDESGRPLWWVAGVPRARRAAWTALLRGQGLSPTWILPLVGAAGAAAAAVDGVVLEVADDRLGVTVVRGGEPCTFDEVILDGRGDLAAACRNALAHAPGLPAQVCGPAADETLVPALGTPATSAPGLWWRGALAACGRTRPVARIPVRDPRPPLVRRTAFWTLLGILLPLAGIAWTDDALHGALARSRDDLAAARREADALEDSVRREKARAEEVRGLYGELAALKAEQEAVRVRLGHFGPALADRRAFLPGLLDALARSVSEEVVLRRIVEVRPGTVRIEGWALTEPAVQLFTRELAMRVRPLGLLVRGHEMRAVEGPYRRPGFAFAFDLTPPDRSRDSSE